MPSPTRRIVLASVGTITLGSLAGCAGRQNPETSPDNGESPCPSSVPPADRADYDGESRVICNDGATTADDSTQLTPDHRSVSLPDAHLAFRLSNRRETYFNASQWDLHKRVNKTWYDVPVPQIRTFELSLVPENSHEWLITIDNSDLHSVIQPVEGTDVTIRSLGSGTYALTVSGSYGTQNESMVANRPWVAYAAQFSIEGEPLTVEPTTDVTDVQRDGPTTIVRATSEVPQWTVTVREVDEEATEERAELQRELITEQLYRHPILRNAIAHFEDDVTEVIVEIGDEQQFQAEPPLRISQPITLLYQEKRYSVAMNPI